ncbi:hypothetical protein ACH4A8_26255 [Streptomyces vietnamensis]|uniref:hypothetical protein n=1 Tax=Streptomyces vietnamensis TaxID=362257 RepID=UPI0037A2600A
MVEWMLEVVLPLGVLGIVLGVVAFRKGWMIPPARRHVRRPRVYGVGVALAGVGLLVSDAVWIGVREGLLSNPPWTALVGNAVLLTGSAFIAASYLLPRRGNDPHPAA